MNNLEDKIPEYLNNALSTSERKLFEQALATDPSLRKELEGQQKLLRFEAFLEYEMTEDEMIKFVEDLDKDPSLDKEFQQYQNAHNHLYLESRAKAQKLVESVAKPPD